MFFCFNYMLNNNKGGPLGKKNMRLKQVWFRDRHKKYAGEGGE